MEERSKSANSKARSGHSEYYKTSDKIKLQMMGEKVK